MNKSVFVVVDSQGTLIGVFSKAADAQKAADRHEYFCRITSAQLK
jgi:hypothetical protein